MESFVTHPLDPEDASMIAGIRTRARAQKEIESWPAS